MTRRLQWMASLLLTGILPLLPLSAAEPEIAATEDAEVQDTQNYVYTAELTIAGPEELAASLRSVSRLLAQRSAGVASANALNRRLRADLETFQELMRSEGYYAANITKRMIPGPGSFQVDLLVEPGPRFRLGKVELKLPEEQPELSRQVLEQLGIRSGDPARAEDIVIGEAKIAPAMAANGYPFAQATNRKVEVDHATNKVNVSYLADPGAFVRFNGLRIEGLVGVEEKYLVSLVTWTQGEAYTQTKVDAYRRRLLGTGLFRTASVRPEPPAEGEESVTVVVNVTERDHRTISLGGGFSTSEGMGGEFNWEHRNTFGQQERLRFQLTASNIEQAFSALGSKPHFDRLDQTLNIGARFGHEDTDAFEKTALGGNISVERKLHRQVVASLGLNLELFKIKDDFGDQKFVVLGAPLVLSWDTSDNPLDPHRGFRLLGNVKPSVALLDSNTPYLAVETRATAYFALGEDKKHVIALRSRLGANVGASVLDLPASERFFSGGGGSVRGFGYQEIGPLNSRLDPLGGRSVAEVGVEFRARVSNTIGIVPFLEGGNVYEKELPDLSGFRWGAGIGFRYFTSVAPFRLDIAFPLNKRPEDSSFQLYVSFGQSF